MCKCESILLRPPIPENAKEKANELFALLAYDFRYKYLDELIHLLDLLCGKYGRLTDKYIASCDYLDDLLRRDRNRCTFVPGVGFPESVGYPQSHQEAQDLVNRILGK